MATRTIKTTGGSLLSATTYEEGILPTSADDIVCTAGGTGTITLAGALNCLSLNFTGSGNRTFTHSSGTISIAGSLTFISGITYNTSSDTCAIAFTSTATGNTITWAGKTPGAVTFNGVGGEWTLQDAFTVRSTTTTTVTLTNGSLNTNNQTCSWGRFANDNSNTRSLTLGTSNITLGYTGIYPAWDCTTVTGFTLSAASSTITFSGQFHGGYAGYTYGNIIATTCYVGGSVVATTIRGTWSCTNLTKNVTIFADRLYVYSSSDTITVNGTFTMLGPSKGTRGWLGSASAGGNLVVNGTLDVDNIDIAGIDCSGTVSWDLSSKTVGNNFNTTGVTFPTGVTTYWVGGTGSASDTTKWANVSGGTGGTQRPPLGQDNVVIDNSSFSGSGQTLTWYREIGYGTCIRNFDAGGVTTNSPNFVLDTTYGLSSTNLNIAGNFTLGAFNSFSSGAGSFRWTDYDTPGVGTRTFTTNSCSITGGLLIFGNTGAIFNQAGNLVLSGGISIGNGARYNTNDYNITCNNFSATYTSGIKFYAGSSTIALTGSSGNVLYFYSSTTMTLYAGTSTWVLSNTGSSARTFKADSTGTWSFYNLTFAGGTGQWTMGTGHITCTNILTLGSPGSYKFYVGKNYTFKNLVMRGSSGNTITLASSTPGSIYTFISSQTQSVKCDWLSLNDCTGSTTNSPRWYAGAHSTKSNSANWMLMDEEYSFLMAGD